MPQPRDRHAPRRASLLARTLAVVLMVATAPVALAADPSPSGDPRTSIVIGEDLEKAKREQELLAKQVEEQQRQIRELERLQGQLKSEITQTATALDAINADLTAVRQQITLMVTRIEEVKAKYAELVRELAALDAELVVLERKEAAKRLELRERQAMLADRLRAAYEADRTSLLDIFLSGGSFSDVLAEVSYHLDVGEQDRALADRIRLDQETLVTLHETVESTRRETNVVRQETAVQKKELDAQLVILEETKQQLAILEEQTATELAIQKQAFEELKESRADLEGAIRRAQQAQQDLAGSIARYLEEQARLGHIPSEFNGTFIWPLVARISGEWGCSTYPGYGPGGPGCDHFHNGIDVVDECGAEIVAAGDGVIAYVGWNWADGPDPAWIVIIAHSTSLKTWYAHLKPKPPLGISQGAKVKAGDVIGYEDTTGHSSGCHLHWMVELNGQFVNPRLFL